MSDEETEQNQEYEEVDLLFMNPLNEDKDYFEDVPVLLSKKEENEMLYAIKIERHSENLLDLSMDEDAIRVKDAFDFRAFVNDRVAEVSIPVTVHENFVTSYKLYKVKTRKIEGTEFDTVVERRFSDFQYLHNSLISNHGGFLIPHLPEKTFWTSLDLETSTYRHERRDQLQKYINRLLSHRKLKYTDEMKLFLFDTENTFSQKKGEHSSKYKMEDKLKKIGFEMYQIGASLYSQYMGAESESKSVKTKEDGKIIHYEILVNNLTTVIEKLKLIVVNTVEEMNAVRSVESICSGITGQSVIEISFGKSYEKLMEGYEELFEFIESCKQALNRRESIRKQLEAMKEEEQLLSARMKHSPRNIQMDILHSQIHNLSNKYSEDTKQLLEQLDEQIILGQSMIKKFTFQLQQKRIECYSQ